MDFILLRADSHEHGEEGSQAPWEAYSAARCREDRGTAGTQEARPSAQETGPPIGADQATDRVGRAAGSHRLASIGVRSSDWLPLSGGLGLAHRRGLEREAYAVPCRGAGVASEVCSGCCADQGALYVGDCPVARGRSGGANRRAGVRY